MRASIPIAALSLAVDPRHLSSAPAAATRATGQSNLKRECFQIRQPVDVVASSSRPPPALVVKVSPPDHRPALAPPPTQRILLTFPTARRTGCGISYPAIVSHDGRAAIRPPPPPDCQSLSAPPPALSAFCRDTQSRIVAMRGRTWKFSLSCASSITRSLSRDGLCRAQLVLATRHGAALTLARVTRRNGSRNGLRNCQNREKMQEARTVLAEYCWRHFQQLLNFLI